MISQRSRTALLVLLLMAVAVIGVGPVSAGAADASPAKGKSLEQYQHFRSTAIDLLGRMPTRAEIAAFEQPSFDFERWLDARLAEPGYVDRLTRVYMDLLRLEPNQNFSAAPAQLYRQEILLPKGERVLVYFRENQRRVRPETDGEFCLSPNETGLIVRARSQTTGTPKIVSKKRLAQFTVLVKPWWLYRDYRAANPTELYGSTWSDADSEYRPVEALLNDASGKAVSDVRVCREEAETSDIGHVFSTGRTAAPVQKADRRVAGLPVAATTFAPSSGVNKQATKPAVLAGGRTRPPPPDKPYAIAHRGEAVACAAKPGLEFAPDCGCGVGLERCIPSDSTNGGAAFYFPNHAPLGPSAPLDSARQSAQRWYPYWWSREALSFLDYLFSQDRDFREILTGRETLVNGPLAQFYRSIQRGNCCGPELGFGMLEETQPLFEPANVPLDLLPQDTGHWRLVTSRGPHAAGILTMPMFLEKYASARARAAAVYSDFLCKSFSAGNQQLTPSTEPDLTIRPGCKTCHATLEPLAAYFARIEPGNFVFLPEAEFPVKNPKCKLDKNGHLNGNCNALYDAAFVDPKQGATLRSAYASAVHADETPVGLARDVTQLPEFASCATERVTSSFLGRTLSVDDAPLLQSLTEEFRKSGFKMRSLVRAIVLSDAYRRSNDASSSVWRSDELSRGSP
jgi:hypothetical protein